MTTLQLTTHARNHARRGPVLLLLSGLTSACALAGDVSDGPRSDSSTFTAAIGAAGGAACVPGEDLTCNGSGSATWYAGRCLAEATCACAAGYLADAASGKCVGDEASSDGWGPGVDAAGGKDVGAVVYVTVSSAREQQQPVLQWLNEFGVAQGARVALAPADGAGAVGVPTVATDGTRYVSCWSRAERVRCAAIPARGTAPIVVYEGPGTTPSLVYGAGSWVLGAVVGQGQGAKTELRRFDADFKPIGDARSFPADPSSFGVGLVLAARAGGFVLVTGAPATIHPLDAQLAPNGAPIPLPEPFWGFASVAATDTHVAVSLAVPYGGRLFHVDPRGLVQETGLSGGGKAGLPLDLFVQGSSIHATWSDGTWHHEIVGSPAVRPAANPESRLFPLAALTVGGNLLVGVAGQQGLRVRRVAD
jgi:hypothetical protein